MMTFSRRIRVLASLSLVILVALTVSACGGSGGANASSPTAATSSRSSPTVGVQNTGHGEILVDAQGQTRHLFKAHSGHVTACDGACAAAWPPLLGRGNPRVAGGADLSLVSTITRQRGARQLTYNGDRLYLLAGDQKPGDVNGQGVTAFGAPRYVLSPTGNRITLAPPDSGSAASSAFGSGY
jgi:predicted lipoprotein with Yx(FWY)xxD motif